MPFNLKKNLQPTEDGSTWVAFGAHEYYLIIGSGFQRVYNELGTLVFSSSSNDTAHLFVLGAKMFLAIGVNNLNNLRIMKWNGSAFSVMVDNINGYAGKILDFGTDGSNYYLLVEHITSGGGFFYSDGNALLKFTGADSGGLSVVKSILTNTTRINSFDILSGDFILMEQTGAYLKFIRRTAGGSETDLANLTGGYGGKYGSWVRVFNGEIHYGRQINFIPNRWYLCKLDSLTAGANEVVIAMDLPGRASAPYTKAIVFDGALWVRASDKVYKYVVGQTPFLYDTIYYYQGVFPLNFSIVGNELIQGATGKFLTTGAICNLTFGTPPYTKTNQGIAGVNNGSIIANATSSSFIQYSLDNATWQSSNTFTGLAPGTYTIYLKDSKGCTNSLGGIVILAFTTVPPLEPVTLSINLKPLNFFNFITWYSASGNVAFEDVSYYNCHHSIAPNGLPKPYRLNKPVGMGHYPWIVNSEQFSFYINFKDDFSSPDFASFKLYLVNETGVVQSDIAPLQRVFAAGGSAYFIYASVTVASVTPGIYRLAIATGNELVFVSQQLRVVTTDRANKEAVLLRYKATVNMYRYLYTAIPTFFHEIRLRMSEEERATEGELVQYRSESSGKLRNISIDLDVVVKMEMYYFDDLAHGAAQILPAHDYIFLNEKSYLAKALFKPDSSNKSRRTSKGAIEFYEQDFSMANRYGKKESLTVVGSDDPLLLGDSGGFVKL